MAESKPECQKNSLRDLLIRPVQRIPSVLLLLQGIWLDFSVILFGLKKYVKERLNKV